MRLVSFRKGERIGFGAVTDGGIVVLSGRLDEKIDSVRHLLAADALERAREVISAVRPELSLDEIEMLPPIPDPKKIVCVGLNYLPHVKETGRELPKHPSLFPRYPDSFVGHGTALVRPRASNKYDFEGELAFVIGRGGGKIAAAEADLHVAGYTCLMDGSIRDWQYHTQQYMPGKNFRRSGSMGPWLVTADDVGDPRKLTIVTRLNGVEMQRGRIDDLIFSIPELVAYISTFMDLEPGDIVSTGTPGGVGFARTPPVFMKPGDTIEVEISGIGTLRNTVVDEA